MRRHLACVLVLCACGTAKAPASMGETPVAPEQPVGTELPQRVAATSALKTPRPGERVRQPLLDDHCADGSTSLAFYYHGGRPVAQRALGDGCHPLYLSQCDEAGNCTQSREQEQGMWCCNNPDSATAHAERR